MLTPSSVSDQHVSPVPGLSGGFRKVAEFVEPAHDDQGGEQPPNTSADKSNDADETASEIKSKEIITWDPEDWGVRRKDSLSQYYGIFLSPDFIDLWGVHRCPALEKRNQPFSKENPFILYPGKIVYLQKINANPEDRFFICVECHFHDKKAKKAMQALVFVPPEFRPSLPSDAGDVDILGSTFVTLNVNQIDWIRTENVTPAAVTWGEFALMRTVLEELSQLPALPDICVKGSDMQPAESKQSRRKRKKSEPLNKKSPKRIKQERKKKSLKIKSSSSSMESSSSSDNNESDDEDIGAGGDNTPDEDLIEIKLPSHAVSGGSKPPKETKKKDRKKSGSRETSDNKKGTAGAVSHIMQSSGPYALPTPANLWAAAALQSASSHTNGLTESDRTWILSEFRKLVEDSVQSLAKSVEENILSLVRRSVSEQRTWVQDKLRQVEGKLDTVGGTLSEVKSKVEEIGGTPSFTWDQIVAQCKQFQEIQMFSKSQEIPLGAKQYHHSSAIGVPPPGGYYMPPSAMGLQNQQFMGPYGIKPEVPMHSYATAMPTSAGISSTSDVGGLGKFRNFGAVFYSVMSDIVYYRSR